MGSCQCISRISVGSTCHVFCLSIILIFGRKFFLVTSYFYLLYCSTKILLLRLVFFGEVGMKVVLVRSTDRTPADWRVQMALHIGTVLGMQGGGNGPDRLEHGGRPYPKVAPTVPSSPRAEQICTLRESGYGPHPNPPKQK